MSILLEGLLDREARKTLEDHVKVVDKIDDPQALEGIILSFYPVNKELLDKCTNLKIVGKHGVGCDTIDLVEAKKHGVKVVNVPTANTNSVAELIVGMILDLSRNITRGHIKSKAGEFQTIAPVEMMGTEVTGKTLGVIGAGNIAKRLGTILKNGFNVSVLAYDPYVSEEEITVLGFEKIDNLKELIKNSDFISINIPLTQETKNLISGDLFNCFKPGAILINAARGGIVNETDLYNALKDNKLRACAMDAFIIEPTNKENNKLFELDNFLATPHIGANSKEAIKEVGRQVVEEVLTALDGKEPDNRVV